MRHSFCTYRLASVQRAAQVALEAGNSTKILFSNYRELATPEEAKIWFTPKTATKISKLVRLAAA